MKSVVLIAGAWRSNNALDVNHMIIRSRIEQLKARRNAQTDEMVETLGLAIMKSNILMDDQKKTLNSLLKSMDDDVNVDNDNILSARTQPSSMNPGVQ